MRVKIAFVPTEQPWSHDWKKALAAGIRRHGDDVEMTSWSACLGADVTVSWGCRAQWRRLMDASVKGGKHHLVMERGFIGDRFAWTSLGFDGLNGDAKWPATFDPDRFERLFPGMMKDWTAPGGYALVMGQVRGDAAIRDVEIDGWYRETVRALKAAGWDVRFRQHPEEIRKGWTAVATGAAPIGGTLADALAGSGLVATYSSNSGVDAALAGIPVHAGSPRSMAWPVASRDIARPERPLRSGWAARLACCQWSMDEISNGDAWEQVRKVAA